MEFTQEYVEAFISSLAIATRRKVSASFERRFGDSWRAEFEERRRLRGMLLIQPSGGHKIFIPGGMQ